MMKPLDEDRLDAESIVRIFLQLYPLLAAHFGHRGHASPAALAELYEAALDDELYGDKTFVASIPSIIINPKVKRVILESEDE